MMEQQPSLTKPINGMKMLENTENQRLASYSLEYISLIPSVC